MKRRVALALIFAAVSAWVLLSRTASPRIPLRADALDQYFYARATWFEPGFRLRGSERNRMLRRAIAGMQVVVTAFPTDEAAVTRAQAEYDTGLCYRALGETDRAREAFLRVRDFRRFTTSRTMHPSGHDALEAIIDAARERLRELDGKS